MYYVEIELDDDPDDMSEDVIEPGVMSVTTTLSTTALVTTTSDMNTENVVQLQEERAGKLKVLELKYDLKNRGKGTDGNKNILFDRLIECIREKTPVGEKLRRDPDA